MLLLFEVVGDHRAQISLLTRYLQRPTRARFGVEYSVCIVWIVSAKMHYRTFVHVEQHPPHAGTHNGSVNIGLYAYVGEHFAEKLGVVSSANSLQMFLVVSGMSLTTLL